jgi:hypothetical protein
MKERRYAACLVAASSSACVLAMAGFACSSTPAEGPSESLPEAGQLADANSDAPATIDGSVVEDASDAAAPDTCAMHAAYRARCAPDSGTSAACAGARLAQCAEITKLESKLQYDSIVECESEASSCDAKAYSTCNEAVAVKAAPTPAQAIVRDHVCEACGGGAAAVTKCKKEFFYDANAGGPGAGFVVFLSSDTLAGQIDAKCPVTPTDAGTDDCQLDFYLCSSGAFNEAHPAEPAACTQVDGG